MMVNKNQREVENRMKDCLRVDRARVQVGKISRFGLLEMSRQRLRPSLGESRHLPCPRCDGQGTIRDIESLSLAILRIIEEEAMKDSTAKVIVNLPVSAATFLLNEKRQPISELQQRLDVDIVIIPSPAMETPQYQVLRVPLSKASEAQHQQASYSLIAEVENDVKGNSLRTHKTVVEQPVVQQIIPAAPQGKTVKSAGLISRIIKSLFGSSKEEKKETGKPRSSNRNNYRSNRNRSSNQNRNRSNRSGTRQRNNPNRRTSQGTKSAGNANTAKKADANTSAGADTANPGTSDRDSRNTGSSRRGRRGGRRRTRGGRDNANTNKQIVNDDEQKTADTQIPVATPTVSESTTKPAESTSPQANQVLDKQTSDSSNITQASSEKISEHAVKESSPDSKTVPEITEVIPHPDRVLEKSAVSNDNKDSQVSSSDNSTSTDARQSTANSGTQDRVSEQVEIATQIVAPHPDNVQSTAKIEAGNTKPPKEKGGDKTNINLSAGATVDERTFLDIGASEREIAGSKDSSPTEAEESKN